MIAQARQSMRSIGLPHACSGLLGFFFFPLAGANTLKIYWTYFRSLWPFQVLLIFWIAVSFFALVWIDLIESLTGFSGWFSLLALQGLLLILGAYAAWYNWPLRNLAHSIQLLRTGRLDEAESALKLATESGHRRWSASSPYWPHVHLTRANLEGVRMNFIDAEASCRMALQLQETLWGDRSFAVIPMLNYLAVIQIGTADYKDALESLRRSLDTWENPRLGWVDRKLRKNLQKMYPGMTNFYRAFALQQRGIVLGLQKRWESSIQTLEEALDWYGWKDRSTKKLAVQSIWLWRCLAELAKSQLGANRLSDASATLETLRERLSKLGNDAARLVPDFQWLRASQAFAEKDLETAKTRATEALEEVQKIHENIPGKWIEFHLLLGRILSEVGDDVEADDQLKRALELCREYKAPQDALVADSLDAYARHSLRTGRTDQGNEFMLKAANIRSHHA